MAYAAVVTLKSNVGNLLLKMGPFFPPSSLKLLKFAFEELNSYEKFVSGLNGSSRKRMEASLERATESILTFGDVLGLHLKDQIRSQYAEADEGRLLMSLEVESLKHEFHDTFEILNTSKKERFNGRDADFGGNKSKMVGLSDLYHQLKEEVVINREDYIRNIFAIVGMAGIGKTALAEAIFEDLDIMECFTFRVWVSVGKNCRLEEIPHRILAQLDPDSARKLAEGHGDMGAYFEDVLEGERWLIVLDDVWDARACDYLESFLPNDRFGSRLVLTSRSRRVAEQSEFICEIRLLSEKESWFLLREKLFGEKYCPPELEEVGKKIAEKCDGLPLTIITVANLLLKIPESLWIDVATKRKHQIFHDAYDEISKVLYPSYEDLPELLKSCFLYMAVFPSNYKISRSRIINMWFIEGLFELYPNLSPEDCAGVCLEEFASNYLVMLYQRRSRSSFLMPIPDPKSCGLHASWWHLCYTEARKQNLFYVLISYEDRLGEKIQSQSKLSIHNNVLFAIKEVYDSIEKNSATTACSLLCLGPYHRYPVPICFGLRLLKNLDALNIRLYKFPLETLELGGLKYFSLTCDEELPASISKFQNLQFFIVHRHHNIKLRGTPSYLPLEIWDMKELKHFQTMGSDLRDDLCGTIMPNLSTLLDVSGLSCTKHIFERIPHLKKLGIRIELALDTFEPLCCFDHIFQLSELEILKCIVVDPVECKFEIVSLPTSLSIFPPGLKKLTLSGFGFSWEDSSKIAFLPCLEVLKLRCNAFRGPEWNVEVDGFPKLRFLMIEGVNLMQWKVRSGSFKELQSISINHCYKLKELHWEFQVMNIKKIELVDCNPSLENIIRAELLRQQHIPDMFSVLSSWEPEDPKP